MTDTAKNKTYAITMPTMLYKDTLILEYNDVLRDVGLDIVVVL